MVQLKICLTIIQFYFFCLLAIPFNANALIGGQVSTNDRDAIFQIINKENSACTVTKITENVLITAAHCLSEDRQDKFFGFSTKIANKKLEFEGLEIEQIIIHPSWLPISKEDERNWNKILQVYDVALIKVKENESFKSIPTMEIDFKEVNPDDSLVFHGYGCRESLLNLDGYFPCKKYSLTEALPSQALLDDHGLLNELYEVLKEVIYKNKIITPGQRYYSQSASLCFGDSGGPVVRNNKLVGINTLYTFNDLQEDGLSTTGVSYLNLHLRISILEDWIKHSLEKLQ